MPATPASLPPVHISLAGATPAPIVWRAVALVLDCLLSGLVAGIILTRVVLPQYHRDAENTWQKQWQAIQTEIKRAETAGVRPQFVFDEEFLKLTEDTGKTFFLTLLIYFVASELVTGGATLGKRTFGLRAARWGTGEVPGIIEIISRCLFKVASLFLFFPFLFLANAIPVFVRPARRAGHDYLARTLVTRDAPPPPEPEDYHEEE